MRLQLAGPDQRLLGPEQYNELFSMHGTRTDFLVRVSGAVGLQQLFLAIAVGSAKHGVPTPQRFFVLGVSRLRDFPLLQLCRWRGTERRLVQLPAIWLARVQPRSKYRLLLAGADFLWSLIDRGRNQFRRHDAAYARPGSR